MTPERTTFSRCSPTVRWLACALLCVLAGCSALPRINPDMARSVPPPQFDGVRGPLTAERSKQILDRLSAGTPGSEVLGRHLALEQALAPRPLTAGNKVRLLQNGPSTYAAMFAAIASARDNIDMESYIFEDDEAGARFADALIERQRAGVQVNLIFDSVGSIGTKAEFFARLRDAGVQVLEFNPINPLEAKAGWDVNQRDHRKLLIVDGRTAFLGGINVSSVYSGGSASRFAGSRKASDLPWRDTDLQIDGPVVADFQQLFMETWHQQKGSQLAARHYFPRIERQGDEVVHAIGGSPEEPYSLIYATFISAIDSAEREVWLTNAYFVPDPQMVASLKGAVSRGVDVRLILPAHTDSGLVFNAGRSYYDELLVDGVKIYERKDALLHAKTAMIDGVWSTVGSTNLDWRSLLPNQEVNAVVLGSEFGSRMRAAFEADMAESTQVTLEQWRRRSPVDRVKESLARLWQYWL